MLRYLAVSIVLALSMGVYAEDLSLTIYNDNLAVVKSAGSMSFKRGSQSLSFTDVASRIDPTSVRFTAAQEGITVLEQNYRFDLVNSMKILQRYIDKPVSLWMDGGELIEGILQSAVGDVVIKAADGSIHVVKSNAILRFEFPELPEGLITRPTLIWSLHSPSDITSDTEVSYMTSGISWHAEYSAVIDENETRIELSSWVSIENMSGASFDDADLKLVAGEINRVRQPSPAYAPRMMKEQVMADAAAGFEERGFFEYHLYDLGRKTSLKNAEIKQISLFDPAETTTMKRFVYEPAKNASAVTVSIEFINAEKGGLGMPLPAGKVRVYKRDTDGDIEFVGEDSIDHTPRNEKVRLTLGKAFDIVGERKILDSSRISNRITQQNVEIRLRNRKEEPVSVTVLERFRGDWRITANSMDFKKNDAWTAEFTARIPADEEIVITYTVRIQ